MEFDGKVIKKNECNKVHRSFLFEESNCTGISVEWPNILNFITSNTALSNLLPVPTNQIGVSEDCGNYVKCRL